ncbi:FkbM family methyltransferase [Paludisphaera rhizosphaerae]|uniref:FkbM family methyltransferase n=1 Tax=Paludisphaera rhizosphaerae TaxID=2711216 RepID=UPI0028F40B15|nr:FkbM family methyltransferase [Paludisphaera rhizosphaerae]
MWVRPVRRYPVVKAGEGDGTWVLRGDLLGPQSIVYSFGLGWDISFDLDLIKRYGCQVFGFEPLPGALRDLERRDLPANFRLLPYGIGTTDGTVHFDSVDGGYASLTAEGSESSGGFLAETRTLGTILNSLGHDHIDVLKMDIEGAEFGLMDEICGRADAIDQLLIEWHHRGVPQGPAMLREALAKLDRHFVPYYISPRGFEHSYISRRLIDA